MVLYGHDDQGKTAVPGEQAPEDAAPPPLGPPPIPDPPPLLIPPPPPPGVPEAATPTGTSPPVPSRPRRRTRTAWLVGAGVTVLVVLAGVLGVRMWDLDGQVSDLTDENRTLTADNDSLDAEVTDLTAERDSIRGIFPISHESLAGADLEGTYEFLFTPVEGACTYTDCDQFGSVSYTLSISQTSGGYALALEGVGGTPAPMSRDADVHSASGVLPEALWGFCGDTPAETSFELHLVVTAVELAGSDLRAVDASGEYRQYTPANLDCGPSESSSTFTARRTG